MTKKKLKRAIFYTRVSTEGQGQSGLGIEGQLVRIRRYAELSHFFPIAEYSEVGSAAGERNVEKRPALLAAMRQAKELKVPIIVDGLERISRVTKDIERLVTDFGLEIISAKDGAINNPVILSSKAARAQFDGQVISDTTTKKLQELKAGGRLLGNRTNIDVAQKNGAAANKARFQKKIEEIADFLNVIDEGHSLSVPEVVKRLNAQGITTGRSLPWTVHALRVPLREARLLHRERTASVYLNDADYGRF